MNRETVPTYEQRETNYANVVMEFDGDTHQLVERTDGDYEPVDE